MTHPLTFHFYAVSYPHGHGSMIRWPSGPRARIKPYCFATIEERDAWVYAGGPITSPDDFRDFVKLTDRDSLPKGWTLAEFKRLVTGIKMTKVHIPKPKSKPKPKRNARLPYFYAIAWPRGVGYIEAGPRGPRACIEVQRFRTVKARKAWLEQGPKRGSPGYRQAIAANALPMGWTRAEFRELITQLQS